MKRVLIAVVIFGVVLAAMYYGNKRDVPANLPLTGTGENAPEVVQEYLALEASAKHHDQTTWAMEIEALKHEKVLIDLWDTVRQGGNAFATLKAFKMGELFVPQQVVTSNNLAHGIVQQFRKGDPKSFSLSDFGSIISDWEKAGFAIEQMEVRQPGFGITNGWPVSRVTFSFHAQREKEKEWFIVRGEAHVTWTNALAAVPFPSRIEVNNLEVLKRTGAALFESVLSETLPRVAGLETLDPYLLVYDLNGDDLPEIALPKHNGLILNDKGQLHPADLCRLPRAQAHAAIFADATGDGVIDLIVADLQGVWVYAGPANPGFQGAPIHAWRSMGEFNNPFVITAGDVDGDGDVDLWLAQYKLPYVEGQMPTPYWDAKDGFSSFLLLNDGKGMFTDGTYAAGLAEKRNRRTYSSSLVDLDSDHDLDLIVVSDFAGIDLYSNDGKGRFTDVTREKVENPNSFGMAHVVADFNGDNSLDILMIGMDSAVADRLEFMKAGRAEFPEHQQMRGRMSAGNKLFLHEGGRYLESNLGHQIARAGWAWGATAFDFENDGDLDLYVVNGHMSRSSAAEYESQFWRHDIYVGKSQHDPANRLFFGANAQKLYGSGMSYGGYHKNKLFLNEGGTNYVEVAYLLGLTSVEIDCRNLVAADLHGDGREDLIFTTFEQWPQPRQGIHILKNNAVAGNWVKVVPPAGTDSFSVEVAASSGAKLTRSRTTGDSFRSQHPLQIHVGLGTENASGIQMHGGVREEGSFSNVVLRLKK